MDLYKLNTVVLSGGGIKCIGYLGFFQSLFSKIDRKQINHYIGTSAGCIFSLVLVLGYELDQIEKIIYGYDFSVLIPNIDIDNIFLNCGLSDGEKIKDLIIQLIEYKGFSKDITFGELFKKTDIKITMTLTNFTKQQIEYINHETNPNLKILDGVLATSRIPLFFYPYKINDDIYLDGAIINNYPINIINNDDLSTVIGACCMIKRTSEDISKIFSNENHYKKIFEYIYNVFLLNFNNVLHNINDQQKKRTINLDNKFVNIIDFNLCTETKNKIINYSRSLTESFFSLSSSSSLSSISSISSDECNEEKDN